MTRNSFATLDDIEILWKHLNESEKERAEQLTVTVSDLLRQEAKKVNKDLDYMLETGELYETVAKSVTVDIVARILMTSTDSEPLSQFSQSALGYTVSGTFLSPGGGVFIKNSELARLGLRRQKMGVIDLC